MNEKSGSGDFEEPVGGLKGRSDVNEIDQILNSPVLNPEQIEERDGAVAKFHQQFHKRTVGHINGEKDDTRYDFIAMIGEMKLSEPVAQSVALEVFDLCLRRDPDEAIKMARRFELPREYILNSGQVELVAYVDSFEKMDLYVHETFVRGLMELVTKLKIPQEFLAGPIFQGRIAHILDRFISISSGGLDRGYIDPEALEAIRDNFHPPEELFKKAAGCYVMDKLKRFDIEEASKMGAQFNLSEGEIREAAIRYLSTTSGEKFIPEKITGYVDYSGRGTTKFAGVKWFEKVRDAFNIPDESLKAPEVLENVKKILRRRLENGTWAPKDDKAMAEEFAGLSEGEVRAMALDVFKQVVEWGHFRNANFIVGDFKLTEDELAPAIQSKVDQCLRHRDGMTIRDILKEIKLPEYYVEDIEWQLKQYDLA